VAVFDRKEDYLYVRWAAAVKKRDHYVCQLCGARGALNSHHLNGWNTFPDERYDVDNGITLCLFHHDDFHNKYGRGGNTKEQFDEYHRICDILTRTANRKIDVERASAAILQKLKDGYASDDS